MTPRVEKKNLHVTLPAQLDAELKDQARRLGTPATVLAREAIEEWLQRKKRAQVVDEMRAYADAMAGTPADLDDELEAAGIEEWPERDR